MKLPEKMKFRIKDEEESSKIQKALFALGYTWNQNSTNIIMTEQGFLYAYDNRIYCGGSEVHYVDHEATEVSLKTLLTGKVNWREIMGNKK